MSGWKIVSGKILRAIIHVLMLLIFMSIPDHWMRATYDSVWVGVPILVNMGGALIYLLFVYVARAVFHGRSNSVFLQ